MPPPTPLPRVYVLQERLRLYFRRLRFHVIKNKLVAELSLRRWGAKVGRLALTSGATLLSVLVVGLLLWIGDFGSGTKASETSLAAAQIIGAALALVLSLSIIPAQRVAELFAIPVLTLFAKDRALRAAFLVLVCTTLLSLLLGTSWTSRLDVRESLSIQFILLGISFDVLRIFYTSTLALLAPESAIKRLVSEIRKQIKSVGRLADKAVAIEVAKTGESDHLKKQVHAGAIVSVQLPRTLQYWSSQLEESAHRFIARRDSNATVEVVDALEVIAREYAELRKKSVNLHLDAKFIFSGPQSDISDVLNAVYESILRIIDDAIASKNERVAQQCIDSMGRMAVHAMSIVTSRAGGQQMAPLAFGAAYYFSRGARAVLTANMLDAVLHAITCLQNILLNRSVDVDLTGMAETVNETLFEIAANGYGTKSDIAVFRSVEAMLQSAQFEIAQEFDADTLKSTLRRILPLVPMEVMADSAGLRHLQVFPPYNPGFEASIPMLLQNVAHKVRVNKDRPWLDPFGDLSDATEAVRDHYRDLTKIDFGHVLLHKYAIDSLGLVLRVLFNQVDALDHDVPDIATACANTLSRIATKVGAKLKPWDLADVHRDMEILARAADATQDKNLAILVRSMITLPSGLTPEVTNIYSDAQQTRLRQLDEALEDAGRRPYRMGDDPVESLYQLVRNKNADDSEEQH